MRYTERSTHRKRKRGETADLNDKLDLSSEPILINSKGESTSAENPDQITNDITTKDPPSVPSLITSTTKEKKVKGKNKTWFSKPNFK